MSLQSSCLSLEPPLKKRKEANLVPGPNTHADVDRWASRSLDALQSTGLEEFGIDFAARLRNKLAAGLCMRTDYSGLGGPEEAFDQIFRALGSSEAFQFTCQRSGDILPYARDLLKSRLGLSRPACVHANILERFPEDLLVRLQGRRHQYLKQASAAGDFEDLGRQFIQEAFHAVMDRMQMMDISQHKAPCVVHGCDCPIFPEPPEAFAGLVCSVAGISCFDFSSMGTAHRFLGESALPFVIWAAERRLADEDFFIAENVPAFDEAMLAQLMCGMYDMVCLRVCPTCFGLPIARDRKYMVFLSKRLVWAPEVAAAGHEAAFRTLFMRQVMLRADEMLRSPTHVLDAFVERLALRRNLPARAANGRPWSCYLAMSRTRQHRVQEHEEALRAAGFSDRSPVLTNIAQRAQHMGPVLSGYAPTLLRKSDIWSFRLRRLVTATELLELQGYNVYGDSQLRSGLEHALEAVSCTNKISLAGNAMHIQCIGCVLLFTLACTVRA